MYNSDHNPWISLDGEDFYRIQNYSSLPDFLMTLTSPENHWAYISSSGGLSAGRQDMDHALFPYYTEDHLHENSENTGSKTLIRGLHKGKNFLWEPFSSWSSLLYRTEKNLYKNVCGNILCFEEINLDLELGFRYCWTSSPEYGLVKKSCVSNLGKETKTFEILDGLQNILPALCISKTQSELSVLLDAYKRSERLAASSLVLYSLNAVLSDKAMPNEALLANTVWTDLTAEGFLLSSEQIKDFRVHKTLKSETECRGKRGAYMAWKQLELHAESAKSWLFCLELDQTAAKILALNTELSSDSETLRSKVLNDVAEAGQRLKEIIGRLDGLEAGADNMNTAHHLSNSLFNLMRGGYFYKDYWIESDDFIRFVQLRSPKNQKALETLLSTKKKAWNVREFQDYIKENAGNNADLQRLSKEYLPLSFSRRHGDPSRPWNIFSIRTRDANGKALLDYQGNWRDIFQNWEALLLAYPQFVSTVITNFLNNTTADGYNPYRISRSGVDWEMPEPDNPWANLGYWSDHQIIYLQKLLELQKDFLPEEHKNLWDETNFTHVEVPYRLKRYKEILENYYDTIEFDYALDKVVKKRAQLEGNDGKLLHYADESLVYSTFCEKILLLLAAKLSNLVPDGGIWMNTQRPEWNDANNALVGKGLSLVTLSYLRRFLSFMQKDLKDFDQSKTWVIHREVKEWILALSSIYQKHECQVSAGFSAQDRKAFMDELGSCAETYRFSLYENGFQKNAVASLSRNEILDLCETSLVYIDHTLRANRRDDGLYHSYNILHLKENSAEITKLYLMLEGQVSILSSGLLSADEALGVLEGLEKSSLYREDQHSYMLYPDREIAPFLQKNLLSAQAFKSRGLEKLEPELLQRIFETDKDGNYHFKAEFRNREALLKACPSLKVETREQILEAYEAVFHHQEFTGRSGTFFAYEGLGSIYWHMVSKLLLASQENLLKAHKSEAGQSTVLGLKQAYCKIRQGLGYKRDPYSYGAFPMDPYSHTPKNQKARQPGMTGQVKEELLTRRLECGYYLENGCLIFWDPLFDPQELSKEAHRFSYRSAKGDWENLELEAGTFGFTCCGTAIIRKRSKDPGLTVVFAQGTEKNYPSLELEKELSQEIFSRSGNIRYVEVRGDYAL